MRRVRTALYWSVPSLVCLALYWPGLLAWFQQDDFVWLNLPNQVHNWSSLWHTVFDPTVQGTWRPLSERIFFLSFGALFGSDALPYRIWVFLTMFANLALVMSVTSRMTRSRAAGFWAAIFWAANSKLATVMSWTCEYILVACGFFLLLAMHFFLRYVETDERRYYIWTWLAFLAGFLAMETNIVFPLLAAAYALGFARKYFTRTLPFFAASAAYGILHVTLAPNQGTVPYTMHFDRALPATFLSYWRRAFEPIGMRHLSPIPAVPGTVEMAGCTLALLLFAVYQARRRQWLPLVLFAWFAILLGPVLPLRDHITDYYLTLPAMALAILGAYALVSAWHAGAVWKVAAAALAVGFLVQQAPVGRRYAQWYRDRAAAQEALVMGVARIHELHPGKAILLDGVDDMLFWGSIQQRPFLFLRIPDVYLTPGSEAALVPHPEIDDVSKFILPAEEARRALEHKAAVVYRVGAGPLRNITSIWEPPSGAAAALSPLRLDVGDPLVADRLGPTWFDIESGFRWMPRAADLRMPGPRSAGQKLYVTAICPKAQLAKGPLAMTLTVDGVRLPPVQFTRGDVESTFAFGLPAGTVGKSEIDVGVEVSRTVRVGADTRDLGLAFGKFEIK
ncbi:MAG TPA: hypothetical protein VMI94_25465 [Bryobacteraceae bacterium]|nr:hypothetical protein [Bryobacteraceae bacterium]